MGITLAICSLSKKRETILREDPSLVWDLSRDVPGYLDLGKAWDALRVGVKPFDAEGSLSKFFVGALGKSFGDEGGFGKPRIVSAVELVQIAKAMDVVPERFLRDNAASLRGVEVHGSFFRDDFPEDPTLTAKYPELAGDDDSEIDTALAHLEETFVEVRTLVAGAAERGEALLVVFW